MNMKKLKILVQGSEENHLPDVSTQANVLFIFSFQDDSLDNELNSMCVATFRISCFYTHALNHLILFDPIQSSPLVQTEQLIKRAQQLLHRILERFIESRFICCCCCSYFCLFVCLFWVALGVTVQLYSGYYSLRTIPTT